MPAPPRADHIRLTATIPAMTTHPHLQMQLQPDLRNPLFVLAWAGWNDAGESASHAARYLAATLDAEQFATIDPEEYYDFTEARPLARYRGGQREIIWPSTDFYALPAKDLRRDVILGIGIEPNQRWRSYMAAVMELLRTMEVDLVITLGAVAAAVPHTAPVTVRGSANSADLAERYGMHPSRYEGPTGIVGVFHDYCRREEIAGISLWAAVPHYLPGIVNPVGARALLQKLEEFTGHLADYDHLDGETERFMRQVDDAMRANENLSNYVRQLEETQTEDGRASERAPEAPRDLPTAEGLIDELEEFLRRSRQDEP